MESIFAKIQNNVSDDGILALISSQLNKLSSSDQLLTDLIQNPPPGLDSLVDILQKFEIPDIDQSSLLNQGISSVKGLLPVSSADFTSELTGSIDGLFANLGNNLISQLTRYIGSFQAIHDLLQIDFSQKNESRENRNTNPQQLAVRILNGDDIGRHFISFPQQDIH